MHFVMLGALLELAGIVVLAVQVIRYERMAASPSPEAADTLEPAPRGAFLRLRAHGLA
jgi:hypothetical protein